LKASNRDSNFTSPTPLFEVASVESMITRGALAI
jgi:hypothetical protein